MIWKDNAQDYIFGTFLSLERLTRGHLDRENMEAFFCPLEILTELLYLWEVLQEKFVYPEDTYESLPKNLQCFASYSTSENEENHDNPTETSGVLGSGSENFASP